MSKAFQLARFRAGDFGTSMRFASTTNALDTEVDGRVSVSSANVALVNGPSGAFGGICETYSYNNAADNLFQRYNEVVGSFRSYTRKYQTGAWSAWQMQYKQDVILGTVSQSAGVPTGAVIERGSNANGGYVKYADGLLICTFTSFSTNNGSGKQWTFPVAFAFSPTVTATVVFNLCRIITFDGRGTSSCQVHSFDNTGSNAVSPACDLQAIGVWF